MRIDNPADARQEIRDLLWRLRQLETASPLSNASISRGGISILVPGEPGPEPGQYGPSTEVARLGHDGGKAGVLLPGPGGGWVTVQEHTDARIATSHEHPNARITSLESFANTYGPTVNSHATRLTAVESLASTANTKAGNAATAASAAQSTANTALSTANGKASTTDFNTLQSQVGLLSQKLTNLSNNYELHLREFHGGWPNG